MQTIIEIPTKT